MRWRISGMSKNIHYENPDTVTGSIVNVGVKQAPNLIGTDRFKGTLETTDVEGHTPFEALRKKS